MWTGYPLRMLAVRIPDAAILASEMLHLQRFVLAKAGASSTSTACIGSECMDGFESMLRLHPSFCICHALTNQTSLCYEVCICYQVFICKSPVLLSMYLCPFR